MDDLTLATEVARLGGAVLRRHFAATTTVDLKRRFDPVTDADRESESAIVEMLRRNRPADGIQAEEGSGTATTGRRWIVDPLDGTVNFVHRIPHVSVSVALYDGDDAVVGVVYDPMRDEMFSASVAGGAWLDGSPIAVSTVSDPASAVLGTGFPYDHDQHADIYAAAVERALRRVNGLRRMGSAALDLAYVACGRYDGYWELWVEPWDMAAGALLVTEAGGKIVDLAGAERGPVAGPIIASNAHLVDLVVGIGGGS